MSLEVKFDRPAGFPDDWGVWRLFKDGKRFLSFKSESDARKFATALKAQDKKAKK